MELLDKLDHIYKRKIRIMEALIQLLFTQFITDQNSTLLPALFKLNPLLLTSGLHLQPNDLQLMQYLIAKNFASYSPAHLQLKLQPHAVLFYQRVFKLKEFASKHLHPHFSQLLADFIANDLLPVSFSNKHLKSLNHTHQDHQTNKAGEGKGKKKKEEQPVTNHTHKQSIDYTRLVCEYSQEKDKEEVECVVVLGQLTSLMRMRKIEEQLGGRISEYLKGLAYKQGEERLQSLAFGQMYRIVKENRAKSQFVEQLVSKVKEEQIEQYILQIFRRYNSEQEKDNTPISRNVLLVFNTVRKFPLCSEKQLMEKTLLPVLILRKCLNLLVADGLINFYPESIRSTLYRITNYTEIQNRFVDHIAQALLNLHKAISNKELPKEQLLKMESMINYLDDILLIFGY